MIKGKNRLICSQVADEWSQYLPDAPVSGIPQNIIPTCQHPRLESRPQSAEREGARVMSTSWHVHGNEDETPTDVADGLNVQGKEALATEEIAGHAMFRDGRTLDLDENTIKTSHNTLENTHVGPLALPKLCGSVLERVGRHVKNDRERFHNGITPRIHHVVKSSFRHAVVLCYVKVRPTGQPPQSHAQLK